MRTGEHTNRELTATGFAKQDRTHDLETVAQRASQIEQLLKSGAKAALCADSGIALATVRRLADLAPRFAEDACGLLRSERFHFLGDSIVEQIANAVGQKYLDTCRGKLVHNEMKRATSCSLVNYVAHGASWGAPCLLHGRLVLGEHLSDRSSFQSNPNQGSRFLLQ